jgi:DNA mismatch endonuclease (patch repair protein)
MGNFTGRTTVLRSKLMSAIPVKRNKSTEIRFIALLRLHDLTGWRRGSLLPGRPDFVFCRGRIAIFLDGCFWHGCPSCYQLPASNVSFWLDKITRNHERDALVTKQLRQRGWRVVRIWECELKGATPVGTKLRRLFQDVTRRRRRK